MGQIVTCMYNADPHELDDECERVTYCLTSEDKENLKRFSESKNFIPVELDD